MSDYEIEDKPTKSLYFDWRNPRLAEFGITSSTPEKEILKLLWDLMDVAELVQSIASSGFFRHEPLIVVKEHGKDVVVEGNRRLAAVKILLDQGLARKHNWNLPSMPTVELRKLESLPVIVNTRKGMWRFLGFKHVNGPAKWSSFAKATYISEVHNKFNVKLADIAEQIGDRHNTVQRLYRGLMVLNQAEKMRVFDREDGFNTRFAFSHLYTGLDYDGIAGYLNVSEKSAENDSPVPSDRKNQLREIMLWMYGSKKLGIPPVVEKQNPHLRLLDAAVKSKEAVSALRDGADILSAFEVSRPAEAVFEEALLRSKRELHRAQSSLTSGYKGSSDLLSIAETIVELADDVYERMSRKKQSARRNRRREV